MKRSNVINRNRSSAFLITTACLLLLLSFGYRSGFGLFVKPITEANGWGREVISFPWPYRIFSGASLPFSPGDWPIVLAT